MTTGRPGKFGAVIRWGQSRLSKRSIVQGSRQEKSFNHGQSPQGPLHRKKFKNRGKTACQQNQLTKY